MGEEGAKEKKVERKGKEVKKKQEKGGEEGIKIRIRLSYKSNKSNRRDWSLISLTS